MKTIVFLIILAAVNVGCGDEEDNTTRVLFNFVVPLNIQPNRENFNIGDTLWLSADFPDTLLEFNSNKYYQLKQFEFFTRMGFVSLLSNEKYMSELPGASAGFKLINKVGLADNFSSRYGDLRFEYSGNRYKCLIGIIPMYPGIYCVTFLSPKHLDLSMIDLGFADDGSKKIPEYRFTFYDINDGHTNVTLLREHMKLATDNIPSASNIYAELKGTLAFKVE